MCYTAAAARQTLLPLERARVFLVPAKLTLHLEWQWYKSSHLPLCNRVNNHISHK